MCSAIMQLNLNDCHPGGSQDVYRQHSNHRHNRSTALSGNHTSGNECLYSWWSTCMTHSDAPLRNAAAKYYPNDVSKQANAIRIEALAHFLPPFHDVLQ